MTELETTLLLKLSELSKFHEMQSDNLRSLVELQSKKLENLTEQVNRLSVHLESLNEFDQR